VTIGSRYIKLLYLTLLSLFLGAGEVVADEYLRLSLEQIEARAEQGDTRAQVELATALEFGEGLPKNPQRAVDWYCRAAAQGSSDAQRSLGLMYANGRSLPRDDRRAAYWLGKAAESGDSYARRFLAHVSADGKPEETGCVLIASVPWLQKRCTTPECMEVVRLVEMLAFDYQLDVNLVLSVISAESAFNPRARSPKGAFGLMQLIPATAKRFGVRDPWDPEQNIRGGMAYLQWLLDYFKGDVEQALAGYNAGERRVVRYRGVPPYAETRAYVKRILKDYGRRRHHFDKRWLEAKKISLPVGDSVVRASGAAASGFKG